VSFGRDVFVCAVIRTAVGLLANHKLLARSILSVPSSPVRNETHASRVGLLDHVGRQE